MREEFRNLFKESLVQFLENQRPSFWYATHRDDKDILHAVQIDGTIDLDLLFDALKSIGHSG